MAARTSGKGVIEHLDKAKDREPDVFGSRPELLKIVRAESPEMADLLDHVFVEQPHLELAFSEGKLDCHPSRERGVKIQERRTGIVLVQPIEQVETRAAPLCHEPHSSGATPLWCHAPGCPSPA